MCKRNLLNFSNFLIEEVKRGFTLKIIRCSIAISIPVFALSYARVLNNNYEVEIELEEEKEKDDIDFYQSISFDEILAFSIMDEVDEFELLPELSVIDSVSRETITNEYVYYHYATSYEYTEEEMETIIKIVDDEAGGNDYNEKYIEAMGVMSVALNRIEDCNCSYLGSTPLEQLTASGQFAAYPGCLNKDIDEIPISVKNAVIDTLNGIRNNCFVSFRAKENKKEGRIQLVETGNNYFGVMEPILEKEIAYQKNK